METIRVAIHGAAGRMGCRLIALSHADPGWQLAAALERRDHPLLGKDAGVIAGVGEIGVVLSDRLGPAIDVVIDFSVPAAALALLDRCRQQGLPLVLATTGFSAEEQRVVRDAGRTIPIVWAPNMSLAVNLTLKLAKLAAAGLTEYPGGADVEIIERHHRFKEDAPSGTALRFGETIAEVMGQTEHRHGRQGATGPRTRAEIGYHAVRVGDNPGEHTIIFGLLGETVELTVRATSRDCYAQGALSAARFVVGKPLGLYTMFDVLGLA
jgi:4-hydroxy-tetrahydrodipicolinate reductase